MEAKSLQQLAAWGYGALVQRELTRDRLLADQPELTPEQQEMAIPALLQRHKLKTQAEVQRWVLSYGLSEQDLKALAERQLRWQLLCEKRFRSQASTLFLKRKSQLDQVVYSLIWVEDEAMAQELFLQLSERESSFEQLWCTLPDAAGQLPTGKQGPIPMGQLPEALSELLRVSQPGHVWPPRPAEGGWVLLRLDELQPAVFNQGHRRDLALELGDQWLQDQMRPAVVP
ncbi:MAG: peptidylprolyl isomerase [Vulcanococcus sp.]